MFNVKSVRILGTSVALAFLTGCADASNEQCEGFAKLPIVAGHHRSAYLGLSEAESRAILRFAIEGGGTCTGTLVDESRVVTAAHCVRGSSFTVYLATPANEEIPAQILYVTIVDGTDLALVALEPKSIADASVTPIRVATEVEMFQLPELVEVAGYGITEDGPDQGLRFAVERIVGVEVNQITVSGGDVSGACLGDSGGPLLMRGLNGTVILAGVLSVGNASCIGRDTFQRVDKVREFQTSASPKNTSGECGTLTVVGGCFGRIAAWCEAEKLRGETCQNCGWNAELGGFRCVPFANDPCRGLGQTGLCNGNMTVTCRHGQVYTNSCDTCRSKCRHSDSGFALFYTGSVV